MVVVVAAWPRPERCLGVDVDWGIRFRGQRLDEEGFFFFGGEVFAWTSCKCP